MSMLAFATFLSISVQPGQAIAFLLLQGSHPFHNTKCTLDHLLRQQAYNVKSVSYSPLLSCDTRSGTTARQR